MCLCGLYIHKQKWAKIACLCTWYTFLCFIFFPYKRKLSIWKWVWVNINIFCRRVCVCVCTRVHVLPRSMRMACCCEVSCFNRSLYGVWLAGGREGTVCLSRYCSERNFQISPRCCLGTPAGDNRDGGRQEWDWVGGRSAKVVEQVRCWTWQLCWWRPCQKLLYTISDLLKDVPVSCKS